MPTHQDIPTSMACPGDGHIFCDGSVPISQLPASYGHCRVATFDNVQIICRGTGW